MREPYESLLGDYHDHWLLSKHLTGDVPDFASIFEDPRWRALSGSEQKFMRIALAFYNGDREATIADLAALDRRHLARFMTALLRSQVHSVVGSEEVRDAVGQFWQEGDERMDHGRALRLLDELQIITATMTVETRPGDEQTLADMLGQLFTAGRAAVENHRDYVAARARAASR